MKRVMGSQLVIAKGVNSGLVVFSLVENAEWHSLNPEAYHGQEK